MRSKYSGFEPKSSPRVRYMNFENPPGVSRSEITFFSVPLSMVESPANVILLISRFEETRDGGYWAHTLAAAKKNRRKKKRRCSGSPKGFTQETEVQRYRRGASGRGTSLFGRFSIRSRPRRKSR